MDVKILLLCVMSAVCCSICAQLTDQGLDDRTLSPYEKEIYRNPCNRKDVCQRGETCILDWKQNAQCVCQSACGLIEYFKNSFQVCSTANVTYQSECHLDREHCLCKNRDPGCRTPGANKVVLDYYGPCTEIPPCTSEEAIQFPARLRDWFFVIMDLMAHRASIGEYRQLWEEAVKGDDHNYAVIWKFCDLDIAPQDRQVSKTELLQMVKTLKASEPCFLPFLDKCDVNRNLEITLVEWGHCMGLKDGEIVDKCHSIHKHRN